MAKSNALQISKRVFHGRPSIMVTDHALTRARSRFRDDKMERDSIKDEVIKAIDCGIAYDRKPPAFTLYRQKPKMLPSHQKVLVDAEGKRAWIVALDQPGSVVVVTSLSRVWGQEAA